MQERMTALESNCKIELVNVTKRFGKVIANDSVNLTIEGGKVLCLLGENGSGKTTLMNVLSGIYMPEQGHILKNGVEIQIRSPKDAFANGIGMIHQHFMLVDVLTVTENIILGLKEKGKLNIRAAAQKIAAICEKYGFDLDPMAKIYDLSVSQKQTVEIVKVLFRGAEILILDEPTAVLTPQETDRLFQVVRNMRADGKAIVLITHKLHEVLSVSDEVAVLRKGKYIGTVKTSEATAQSLTDMMVGRAVSLNIDRPDPVDPKPRLKIEGLTCVDNLGVKRLDDVTFTAMSGEILGIAGIAGSGQRELLECITGLYPVEHGTVTFLPEGKPAQQLIGKTPNQIRKAGVAMAFVPEDRLGMGLVGSMGMGSNMMLRSWRKGKGAFVNRRDPNKLAMEVMEELEVVTPSISTPVRRLSGGNVQKVLVGREIAMSPSVLLTAYAVRGLDINTSYTIYNLLTQQKMKGSAVVFVGEDLDVLLELCDRILVLCGGKISGIVDARTATKEEIGLLMTKV